MSRNISSPAHALMRVIRLMCEANSSMEAIFEFQRISLNFSSIKGLNVITAIFPTRNKYIKTCDFRSASCGCCAKNGDKS